MTTEAHHHLADRAVLFSYGEGEGTECFVFPIFPGACEMQFWKRPDSEEAGPVTGGP